MPRVFIRQVLLLAVIGAIVAPAMAAEPVSPRERKEMVELARRALGPDADASDKAIESLKALGDPARPRLVKVVQEVLTRGRTLVGTARRLISDPAKAKALEEEMATVRAAAVANVDRLGEGETIRIAHDNYGRLEPMLQLMNSVYEIRDAVRKTMTRRARLLALWRELGGDDKRITPANEETLKAEAEEVLGMTLERAAATPEFPAAKAPGDPAEWLFWFYDACRRIEAYNQALEPLMSPGEAENIRCVNTYREMLGILPVEVDPRLLQSARRHSREMVTLGYFAHESPTPGNRTHSMRMQNAGYADPYSENIASGAAGGRGVFWMWFDSPGHHKNMVHAASAAMGVGKWGSTWTQNFGTGPRLMGLDPADREKAVVKGEILEPYGGGSRRS